MKDIQVEILKDATNVRGSRKKVNKWYFGEYEQNGVKYVGITDGCFIKLIHDKYFYLDILKLKEGINNIVAKTDLNMATMIDVSDTQPTRKLNEIVLDDKRKLKMQVFQTEKTNERVYIDTRYLDYFDDDVKYESMIGANGKSCYSQIIIKRYDEVQGIILPIRNFNRETNQ